MRRTFPAAFDRDHRDRKYNVKIYQYTCTGAFRTSSRPKTGTDPYKECAGIYSKLKLINLDNKQYTEKEAAEHFQETIGPSETITNVNQESSKPVELAPAIFIKGPSEMLKLLFMGSKGKENSDEIEYQEWKCYGVTKVDLLVLVDTRSKLEFVAGVAPDCFGYHVRAIKYYKPFFLKRYCMGPITIDSQPRLVDRPPPVQEKESSEIDWNEKLKKMQEFMVKTDEKIVENLQFIRSLLNPKFGGKVYETGVTAVKGVPNVLYTTYDQVRKVYKRWQSEDDDK